MSQFVRRFFVETPSGAMLPMGRADYEAALCGKAACPVRVTDKFNVLEFSCEAEGSRLLKVFRVQPIGWPVLPSGYVCQEVQNARAIDIANVCYLAGLSDEARLELKTIKANHRWAPTWAQLQQCFLALKVQ